MKHSKFRFLAAAGSLILAMFLFSACNLEDAISETAPVGIYVGVVSFQASNNSLFPDPVKDLVASSAASNSLTSRSLVYLSDKFGEAPGTSKDLLKNQVLSAYSAGPTNNTPLYYAVDHVIKDLKNSEDWLSSKLDNVTIVTFTDGYDQGSADYANKTDNNAYGDSVKVKIRGNDENGAGQTKIKGKNINAYAVAVKDSTNQSLQSATLNRVSSGTDTYPNVFSLDNYNDLSSVFSGIANSLTSIKYISSLTVTISGPSTVASYSGDNNFSVTFDGLAPDTSSKWIKGKVAPSGNKWEIQNVSFSSGLSASLSGNKAVESGRRGVNVDFGFPGFTGVSDTGTIKEYYYTGSAWQEMEGANAGGWTFAKAEQKSAIIYLVLDATLDADNITKVRTAAQGFIDQLYNESKAQ